MASTSMVVRGQKGIREWFDGLKSPGGALAESRGESKSEKFGHAVRGGLEGAGIGAAVGVAEALAPGQITPGMVGVGALVALASAAYTGHRSLSNIGVGLAAVAGRDMAVAMAAAKAGTTAQVAAAKSAQVTQAASGTTVSGEGIKSGDPLIQWGKNIFASLR
jgi:hypothetical protein